MDDGDAFGLSFFIAQDDLTFCRTSRVDHAFKFQTGEDIFQFAIAILRNARCIKEIVAGRKDDIAHINLQDFIFLLKVNGIGFSWAKFLTGFAFTSLKVDAVFFINNRVFGHSLREGSVDYFSFTHPSLEDVVYDFEGAFFNTDSASSAVFFVDIARFFSHGHGEVAQEAIYLFDFTPGEQGNIVMLININHLGGQDTG